MIKWRLTILVIISIVSSGNTFELACKNNGVEFGWSSKHNLKNIVSLNGYYCGSQLKLNQSGISTEYFLQWWSIKRSNIRFNFLSGIHLEYMWNKDYVYPKNNWSTPLLNCNIFTAETQINSNEMFSFFVRIHLLQYYYNQIDGFNFISSFSPNVYGHEFKNDFVMVGIRMDFGKSP